MNEEKPYAITLNPGSSQTNKTGSWRAERPVYVDRMPPCNNACPAGENIQRWLYHAEEAGYEQAWRQIMEDNPLPAVMGRVCYRPCETACNRGQLDAAVGINSVERFLGDYAIEQRWTVTSAAPPSGKRVLVIGSGPSGLSAAYHLRRRGHEVVMCEAFDEAGGMMRYGIPKYRLPREILDAEIDRLLALGIDIHLGRTVSDVEATMQSEHCDAVFIATGAQIGKRAYIPAGDSARILDAVSFLHRMEDAEPPQLGRRVVVYGGGDTAMDAARTALRIGATDPIVVYRRVREKMPAHDIEVAEAIEEGITIRWLSTIKAMQGTKLQIEKMALDESGFPRATGEFEELDADSVILALGQDADLSLMDELPGVDVADGSVVVGGSMMTGKPGVFAGGDMVKGERTVTTAIGHGKRAARSIDAWLRGEEISTTARHELAEFGMLNTWYYSDAPATIRPSLEVARRRSTFDEVVGGLDRETALFEARRCLSCGNCFECDNCYGMCPDNAVMKLGPGKRFAFDYDFCKGCGICAAECPAGAIVMVPERI